MAESSRDTTQLIRLVYASMCVKGRGGGEVRWRMKWCQKRKWIFFPPFERFFCFLTDWMGTESYFRNVSWICGIFFECHLMTASVFWQGTPGGNLDIHYSLTFCPFHRAPSSGRPLSTSIKKSFLRCTQQTTYRYNNAVFDFILPRGKLWVGLTD